MVVKEVKVKEVMEQVVREVVVVAVKVEVQGEAVLEKVVKVAEAVEPLQEGDVKEAKDFYKMMLSGKEMWLETSNGKID